MMFIARRCLAGFLVAFGLLSLTWAAAAQTPAKSTWDTIKERGSIRVGVLQGEPYGFKDPGTNEWSGMNVALGQAIAKALGVKLDLVEVTWGTAVASLQSNKIDVMPFLNATPERAVVIDYANAPLSYDPLGVLLREGITATKWEDLNKPEYTIAVAQGSSQDAFVTRNLPKAKILRFPTYSEQAAAFASKTADILVLYHSTLVPVQAKMNRGQIVIPKPVRADAADMALRREPDKTLRDWLALAGNYYYSTNATQEWYEQAMKARGYDPSKTMGVKRENW